MWILTIGNNQNKSSTEKYFMKLDGKLFDFYEVNELHCKNMETYN